MSDTKTEKPDSQEKGEVEEHEPMTAKELVQMAQDYHVPMTTKTIDNIVGKGKEISPEKAQAFEEYVKRQAAGLFPTMAPQIMAGMKTSDLLEPYRQTGKQVLGQSYEPNFQTNIHDRAALEGGTDPQSGRSTPMNLTQWQQHLKTDPVYGWADSPQGKAATLAVKQRILSGMSQ